MRDAIRAREYRDALDLLELLPPQRFAAIVDALTTEEARVLLRGGGLAALDAGPRPRGSLARDDRRHRPHR
ncbi:hypothetical protein [Nannocystis pusilla]|uniref:hypothetical protein n=1 Tax=Nannocystis pusilla TaxID=889268 RepID=UPI003B7623EE